MSEKEKQKKNGQRNDKDKDSQALVGNDAPRLEQAPGRYAQKRADHPERRRGERNDYVDPNT